MKIAGVPVHKIDVHGDMSQIKGAVFEHKNPITDDLPIEQICNPMKFRNELKARLRVEKSIG